jgi:nucleoside-diphosphate-sugar epimerase
VRQGSDVAALEAVLAKYPGAKVERFVGSIDSVDGAARVVEGCATIFHLAAATKGPAAELLRSTVDATKNLYAGILRTTTREHRPRVVLVSSFGVYGVADLPRGALVDESTPLEAHASKRDPYSQAKLRQEQLCWDYQKSDGIPLTVIRPGAIYGPRGGAFSARVGLGVAGIFLHLGGRNTLPLTYVDNCAEAVALVGEKPETAGQAYNVVDDELITCDEYLRRYKKNVRYVRSVSLPYPVTVVMSHAVARLHRLSRGKLPAVFTPYTTATTWKGNRFANAKLKALGWRPIVPTNQGLERTFESLRAQAS